MKKILVTGATGYVGGQLIPELIEKGYSVSVLVRDNYLIREFPWFARLEKVIVADLLDENTSWVEDFPSYDVAFYLIHSIYSGKDFNNLDKKAATNFASIFKNTKKVVYLGGLLPEKAGDHNSQDISEHLSSRKVTGQILQEHFPVTEFRAGPVIGSGSASFEMIRYLTERLPIMVTPKWVNNVIQPISIHDVIKYLLQSVEMEPLGIVDIGSEKLSFKDLMLLYAEKRNLKRIIIPLPVLTPTLASLWVGLVTPIPNTLAKPLIEGIISPIIAQTQKAKTYFPDIVPLTYTQSLDIALENQEKRLSKAHWSMAVPYRNNYELKNEEGFFQERCIASTSASAENIFKIICQIGGESGWLTYKWLWKIRGFIDRLLGGPGLIRGRRSSHRVMRGEVIDFWRVENVVENKELLLRAEMKLPGKAWLRFNILEEDGITYLVQTALFQPCGLWGILYWYFMYPAHKLMFPKMVKTIVQRASATELVKESV